MNVSDLKSELSFYNELDVLELEKYIYHWKKTFFSSDKILNVENWGYLWHYFSFNQYENQGDFFGVLKRKFSDVAEIDILIFDEDQDEGILTTKTSLLEMFERHLHMSDLDLIELYSDLYITPLDFSWTLVLPHEINWKFPEKGIGPFLVSL